MKHLKLFFLIVLIPGALQAQMTGFAGSSPNTIVRDFFTGGSASDSTIAVTAGTITWNFTPSLQGAFSAKLLGGATQAHISYTPVPSTPTEVWFAFQYQFPTIVNGGSQIELISNTAELLQTFMTAGGNINLSRNGGSGATSVGAMVINTTYYCWGHINTVTGAADFEFQTGKQRLGSGNNFVSIANAGTSGGVNTFEIFAMDTTSGHDNIYDSVLVSTSGYPIFP